MASQTCKIIASDSPNYGEWGAGDFHFFVCLDWLAICRESIVPRGSIEATYPTLHKDLWRSPSYMSEVTLHRRPVYVFQKDGSLL